MDSNPLALVVDRDPGLSGFRGTESASRWRSVPPRLLAAIWLVLLAGPLETVLDSHPSRFKLWLCLVGLALFTGIYIWHLLSHPLESAWIGDGHPAVQWTPVITLTGLGLVMTVGLGPAFLMLFVFAGVTVGTSLPTQQAATVLGVVIVIATACGALSGAGWSNIAGVDLTIFGIGAMMILLAHLIVTVRDLRAARLEIARLAVSEERLRFSRDLHDLLGHSLSLITLKSELAGRLMESNPEKAAVEIHDIERIARSALQETRETVAGYRQPTLEGELRAAREMITAAGISFVAGGAIPTLPADVDGVLAWAVREGVTNVIRHSRATQCTIKIGTVDDEASIEVTDNGKGVSTRGMRDGNGLKGLTERVAARDGHLVATSSIDGGFRLRVVLPIASESLGDQTSRLANSL